MLPAITLPAPAVVPLMRRQRSGRIINIASIVRLVPLRLQSAFVAAKAAVINLTKSMAIEFLKPVYVEQTLRVEGKVLELIGKHEAVMEGCLSNSDGAICTQSTAKFAIFSPAVAKRLGIANEEHLSWFEQIYNMKR